MDSEKKEIQVTRFDGTVVTEGQLREIIRLFCQEFTCCMVPDSKIGRVIGKGGTMIKALSLVHEVGLQVGAVPACKITEKKPDVEAPVSEGAPPKQGENGVGPDKDAAKDVERGAGDENTAPEDGAACTEAPVKGWLLPGLFAIASNDFDAAILQLEQHLRQKPHDVAAAISKIMEGPRSRTETPMHASDPATDGDLEPGGSDDPARDRDLDISRSRLRDLRRQIRRGEVHTKQQGAKVQRPHQRSRQKPKGGRHKAGEKEDIADRDED